MKLSTIIAILLFLAGGSTLRAETPREADFVAARSLGQLVGDWVGGLEERISSVGIFYINIHAPLSAEYAPVLETEVVRGLYREGVGKVLSCTECRVPLVNVEADRIVLSKNVPDMNTFKLIGGRMPVQSFLVLEVHRTAYNVKMQATLYHNPTARIIAAETFTVPALDFSDASVQLLITFGSGRVIGNNAGASLLPIAANISLLEEIGFAKGGLNLGAIFASPLGTLIYVNPTLAFRGHFGRSGLAWSLMFGAGYGFVGSARGISTRAAAELYFGSLAVLGIEASYLVSAAGGTTNPLPGFAGIHAGINFGR